ncbi:MAG: hypothetical protein IKW51_08755 [Bacteroidales bacterium]|nr:hypothetical protein [Bacteroidales bacterium]
MKIRNKSENNKYKNHVESAIDEIEQAIDSITYSCYPNINQRLIKELKKTVSIMNDALDACIFKP